MSRVCSERGQGSLEWLAVVALVATLLGVGTALAQAGFVGRRITREMARAVCLVGNGDCRRDQEPCVIDSRATRQGLSVDVAIVRLGEDELGMVERRSDGTFAVTIEQGRKGGLGASQGLSAGFELGKIGIEAGGEVAASLVARQGEGRTWIVGSAAEAERILASKGTDREPDVASGSGTWTSTLGASAGVEVGVGLEAAQAGLELDRVAGWRLDRRTGHRTAYVQASSKASASAGSVLGLAAGGAGEIYAVELDAGGRPVDLRVIATGRFGGSRDLPAVAQPVAGLLATGDASGRRYEVTGHLDLTDGADLAAARGLLEAIAHRRATVEPARALRRRIDERGTVEARVLATQDEETGGGLQLTLELAKVGARAQIEQHSQRLLAATSRGLDGQWITRTDCVA